MFSLKSLFVLLFLPLSGNLLKSLVPVLSDTFEAVNYNRWSICKAAEILGKKEKLPVYKFLKEPLVRRFGKDWYEALEEIAGEWEKPI